MTIKTREAAEILLAGAFVVLTACNTRASPLVAMRLRANETDTPEIW